MTFSAAALDLVTKKKPDFCGFRIPDGHKVASKDMEVMILRVTWDSCSEVTRPGRKVQKAVL